MHEFRLTLVDEWSHDGEPPCKDLMGPAERAFTTFRRAVTELFGAEQASQSAEDWLNELATRDNLPGPTRREWQVVTVAALARLAIRMTVALDHPNSTKVTGGI